MKIQKIYQPIVRVWNLLLAIIYPELCLGCQDCLLEAEKFICTSCQLKLPFAQTYDIESKFIQHKIVTKEHAFLKYHKGGIVQKLIYDIKYSGNKVLALELGKAFQNKTKTVIDIDDYDYAIPVPLHKNKQSKRGFNQSEEIAKGFLTHNPAILNCSIVERVVDTKTQTHKGKLGRLVSLNKVFQVTEPYRGKIQNKKILLIDDVITTGATISQIVDILETERVKEVCVISLALSV